MQNNHSSSLSPIGSRVMRIPPGGSTQQQSNGTAASNGNMASGHVRENLNKSQNIAMPSGVNNAYAP